MAYSFLYGCTRIIYLFSILIVMNRFLSKLCLVSAAFLLLSVSSFFSMLCYMGSWNQIVLVDKAKRSYVSSLQGRKICFVGGSNLSYGLDSRMVQTHFGVQVANMGLHAGLGMNYMLYEIKPYLRQGDVLVVVPEYNQFTDYYGSSALADLLIQTKQWSNLHMYKEWTTYPSYFCSKVFIPSLLGRKVQDDYADNPSGFSEIGDYILHLDQERRPFPCLPLAERPKESQIRAFSDELKALKSRGVRVILLPPPYAQTSFERSAPYIEEIATRLATDSVAFDAAPSRYCLADTLFWNTAYHLSAVGRKMRTEMVIADLERIGIN